MGKIQVLSEETINQIAAGEVIENPASVVKELLENALDAGATQIVVEIKGGGFQSIRISDDGCGMEQDDALLSLERHATSKIKEVEDLQQLQTMGFRGEALASIAAVSQMTLTTASHTATRIEIEGGKILHVGPASRTRGTTIEVRSLFYNVPARKKFQKSAAASGVEIHRALVALSLGHPEVSFELIHNEQRVFSATPSLGRPFVEALRMRMKEVLGEGFGGLHVAHESLRGFLGVPSETRPNRTGQYLFINRRLVTSPLISFAVRDAYGTRLDKDRHPIYVLHLNLPSDVVDVNVHPQKKEVRFQDEAGIRRKVQEAVHVALSGKSLPPAFEKAAPLSFSAVGTALKFRETGSTPTEVLPWNGKDEPEALPVGIFEHFLLLDAATVAGYEPGILIVDLLAIQEKLAYDALKKEDQKAVSQGLLLPLKLELTPADAKALELHLPLLERMGFSLASLGSDVFSIDAIPSFLLEAQVKDAILSVLSGEDKIRALARFARRQKKTFVLQEALALWTKVQGENHRSLTAYLSRDALGKLCTS